MTPHDRLPPPSRYCVARGTRATADVTPVPRWHMLPTNKPTRPDATPRSSSVGQPVSPRTCEAYEQEVDQTDGECGPHLAANNHSQFPRCSPCQRDRLEHLEVRAREEADRSSAARVHGQYLTSLRPAPFANERS